MEAFEWIMAGGVVIGAGTAIVVVCRFIFRLDARVETFGKQLEVAVEAIQSCLERTARLEGRVDELSQKRDD